MPSLQMSTVVHSKPHTRKPLNKPSRHSLLIGSWVLNPPLSTPKSSRFCVRTAPPLRSSAQVSVRRFAPTNTAQVPAQALAALTAMPLTIQSATFLNALPSLLHSLLWIFGRILPQSFASFQPLPPSPTFLLPHGLPWSRTRAHLDSGVWSVLVGKQQQQQRLFNDIYVYCTRITVDNHLIYDKQH